MKIFTKKILFQIGRFTFFLNLAFLSLAFLMIDDIFETVFEVFAVAEVILSHRGTDFERKKVENESLGKVASSVFLLFCIKFRDVVIKVEKIADKDENITFFLQPINGRYLHNCE